MENSIFDIFRGDDVAVSIIDYLNRSEFDELIEIDLNNNRLTNIYHVEGKYFVPIMEGPNNEIFEYSMEHMIHPDDRQTVRDLMDNKTLLQRLAYAEKPGILEAQFRYRLLDGGWRWVEQVVVGGAQHGFGDGVIRVYIFDIQNQKDRQQGVTSKYAIVSDWDEMTGLYRKKAFFSNGEQMLKRRGGNWSMLSIDIEHFRLFNEWYGHESGDLLLAQIGGLLKGEENRCGALAGYMGQDDFCLLVPTEKVDAEKLYTDLHRLITARGASMGFLPAIGICRVEGPVMAALDRATIAASYVRGNFRNRIRTYEPSMSNQTDREYRMLSDFQRALRNHELSFDLQPQCVVSSGAIVGAESLARWRTPEGKEIYPDDFIPILEKYGFVTDLDEYIWDSVCAWLQNWIETGHKPVPVSVNVSRVDFFTIDVPDYMEKLLRKYNLARELLKIEVTESAYVDDANSIRDSVQRLRDRGFLVLMDDFGSGYSSLNMLRTLNMDVIKLDAQFLHMGEKDEKKGVHIVETIVNMTKAMALPIIVEGVESAEQVDFLEKLGCRYIQGNYFHAPLRVADFEKLIGDGSNTDSGGFAFFANQQFSIREFMDQNIYSDSMLNNILGAAAFYCWNGDRNVDIVRYNEQFYRLVNVPDFSQRLTGIQQYFHPNDIQPFFDLLAEAERDRLNGSSGVLGVYRTDGSLGTFFEHFYFLEETENGKMFYGAMQEITEVTSLQNQMRLLSRFSSESVVFLRNGGDGWHYQVVIHGIKEFVSKEKFEEELNNGRFLGRLDEEEGAKLRALVLDDEDKPTSMRLLVHGDGGKTLQLYLKIDFVHDERSNVEYILTFRTQEDA